MSTPVEAPVQRNGYLYWVTKIVLTIPLRLALRPKVEGLHHVPTSGPAILASNHTSFYDWLVLPLVVPRRRIIFLAKSSYFTGRGLRGGLRRYFFTACGQVPVDRSGGGAGEAALRTAVRLLDEGNLLGVFPEGTRSMDGRLHRGRTGVVRMAAASGVPVIPCAAVGLFAVAPSGAVLPRITRRRTVLRFAPPMDWPVDRSGEPPSPEVLRARTDELMAVIRALSGQEYSGVDARSLSGRAEP